MTDQSIERPASAPLPPRPPAAEQAVAAGLGTLLSPVAAPPGGTPVVPRRPPRSQRRAVTRRLRREQRASVERVRRALEIISLLSADDRARALEPGATDAATTGDADVAMGDPDVAERHIAVDGEAAAALAAIAAIAGAALAGARLDDATREALEAELGSIPEAGLLEGSDAALWRAWWAVRLVAEEMRGVPELREACFAHPDSDFTRERDLPLHRLLVLLMAMGGGCLDEELWDAMWPTGSVPSASALTQRRELLTDAGCMYLFRRVTEECMVLAGSVEPPEPFHGIPRLLAVDGCDVNVSPDPNSKETRVGGRKRKGWNQYHLNCLYDVGAQQFVAAELQPKRRTHETKATCDMVSALELDCLTLLVGDRGYGSLNLIETVRRKENLHCLIRVKNNWIREIAELKDGEDDVDMCIRVITTQTKADKERIREGKAKYLSGASKFGKYKRSQVWFYESEVDVRFRVVRVALDSGEVETLVTTLPREGFPPEVLSELYHVRWQIENSYRVLKWQNHLARMHCRRDDLSRQEVWARLAMHNLVSAVVACAGRLFPHEDAPDAKYRTVCDRHRATFCCATFLLNPGACPSCVTEWIARGRTPVRPGRTSPRDKRAIGFAALNGR